MKYIVPLLFFSLNAFSQVWQWSVPVKSMVSSETNDHPTAFLWIPENCKKVKAVVIGQHNMQEEGIMEHPIFRKVMREQGVAEIWITPGIDSSFDPERDGKIFFNEILKALGEISGYKELEFAPVIPIGHSAYATYPWNFAAWFPKRTLAVLSIHGDAPQTNLTGNSRPNLDWEHRNTNGIPGLMVMGEYEWWEDRLTPAMVYKNKYPDAPVSLLADAGHGHFDHSDMLVEYLALFIKKAVQYRVPRKTPDNQIPRLKAVTPQKGWLKDRWYPDQRKPEFPAASYNEYKGNKETAFWYFDEEMADVTEQYYAKARGKQNRTLGFYISGKKVNKNEKSAAQYSQVLDPLNDNLTFTVVPFFTDSLGQGKVEVEIINGPVKKLDDSTFRIAFYHMGLNNKKRTSDIWLVGHSEGTDVFKSSVQQLNLKFTYPKTEGKPQHITFKTIGDIKRGTKAFELAAKSSSALPVKYYVKQGPAEIEEGVFKVTNIPPRSKFPVKVTIVAWQYGNAEYQSAEAVEKTFYIVK